MKILYYSWQENSTKDMLDALQSAGHSVTLLVNSLDYYLSEQFQSQIYSDLAYADFDFIFTFNYFAAISNTAQQCGLRYVSWIFDCPNIDIYSTTISNPCNYIFLFDKNMLAATLRNHARHAYHLPLAFNDTRLKQQLHLSDDAAAFAPAQYQHDISFVGSLYERSNYDRLEYAKEHTRGYLHGIIASQKKVWGQDLISPVLTNDRCLELAEQLSIDIDDGYTYTAQDIYTSLIQKKITSEERIEALNRLSEQHSVSLYTDSDTSLCPNTKHMGTTSYFSGMPDVFYRSKINLNITLRSITSGIPLRAIDILGCGGFLLSNYQEELCEYFIPGEDFVYYEDVNDLLSKTDYYLTHETERQQIAYHGHCKASQLFTYDKQVAKMIAMLD